MLTAFFVLAFILATITTFDERLEGLLEEKLNLSNGKLGTALVNFLGMGASFGAAASASAVHIGLVLLGVGLGLYFLYKLSMVLRRFLK